MLAYAAGTTFLPVHFILMAVYAIWLIVIKPRSSFTFAIVQALIAILIGSTALAVFAANYHSLLAVARDFVIG